MSAYFIDLDGVFFKYGTMIAVPKAVEIVNKLMAHGDQVYFVTKRTTKNNIPPSLNVSNTKKTLQQLKVKYSGLIEGATSPRVVVNDEGAISLNHRSNAELSDLAKLVGEIYKDELLKKIYHGFSALAWTAWKYAAGFDADDYVQPILIAKSLIYKAGFNHRDLIKRYRAKTNYIIHNQRVLPSGVAKEYHGQLKKLFASKDPLYVAKDGVSDGAAMKVLPIVVYYLDDLHQLIHNVDRISKLTHNTVEARLSAILIALRYRQVLLNTNQQNIDLLLREFKTAIKELNLERESDFFLDQLKLAAKITKSIINPEELLLKLAKNIGLDHLAWCTPIAACFWSFAKIDNFPSWLKHQGEKSIFVAKQTIGASYLRSSVWKKYQKHLLRIGQYKSYYQSRNMKWRQSIDVDTFFSIAFSILAIRDGISSINHDLPKVRVIFYDNLYSLGERLLNHRASYYQLEEFYSYLKNRMIRLINYLESKIIFNLGIKRNIAKLIGFFWDRCE